MGLVVDSVAGLGDLTIESARLPARVTQYDIPRGTFPGVWFSQFLLGEPPPAVTRQRVLQAYRPVLEPLGFELLCVKSALAPVVLNWVQGPDAAGGTYWSLQVIAGPPELVHAVLATRTSDNPPLKSEVDALPKGVRVVRVLVASKDKTLDLVKLGNLIAGIDHAKVSVMQAAPFAWDLFVIKPMRKPHHHWFAWAGAVAMGAGALIVGQHVSAGLRGRGWSS